MKNAGLAGAIALCGIGLMANVLIGTGVAVHAIPGVDRMSQREGIADQSDSSRSYRGFDQSCGPENASVTWEVFEPTIRPLVLTRGEKFLTCFDIGDDASFDLDNDGVLELVTEDGAGIQWDSFSGSSVSPLTSIRRTDGDVVLDVIMTFDSDITYWLDLIGVDELPTDGFFYAESQGYLDIDGDHMLDLIMKVKLFDYSSGSEVEGYFWYRNALTPPGKSASGDVNGDGQVNGADLTIVLSDWTG